MLFRTLTATVLLFVAAASAQSQSLGRTPDYIVGAEDVLIITSYDQDSLSGEYRVQTDGTFGFPLLGRIAVGGKTLAEVEEALRRQLIAGGFFKHPEIAVAVKEYRSRKIFVLGEVRNPGVHTLSGPMRLVEALALADSTLPTAGPEVVIIPSGNDASRSTVRVNIRELEAGDASQNVALQDGDTILVARAEEIYVFGHVKNPGAYVVRDHDITVLQALSMAGGVTDRGAMSRIDIVRIVEGTRKELRVDLGDPILPGDTIVVPERFF
jgi:polysaccharide export outer membrane protein